MAGMLHCPKCSSELVNYRKMVLIGEAKGCRCVVWKKFYRTEELMCAILTV